MSDQQGTSGMGQGFTWEGGEPSAMVVFDSKMRSNTAGNEIANSRDMGFFDPGASTSAGGVGGTTYAGDQGASTSTGGQGASTPTAGSRRKAKKAKEARAKEARAKEAKAKEGSSASLVYLTPPEVRRHPVRQEYDMIVIDDGSSDDSSVIFLSSSRRQVQRRRQLRRKTGKHIAEDELLMDDFEDIDLSYYTESSSDEDSSIRCFSPEPEEDYGNKKPRLN